MNVTSDAVFRTTQGQPITGRWSYDTTDPHAVTLTFHRPTESAVEWVFARDLLTTALQTHRMVGEGDIQLLVTGSRLLIVLRPPGDALRVSCPTAGVSAFLDTTRSVSPPCADPACVDPFCVEHGVTRAALDEALTRILQETS